MRPQKRAPLEEYNAEIVQVPLRGLLTNMDRACELESRLKTADQSHDREAEHSLSLLLIMLRFTSNSTKPFASFYRPQMTIRNGRVSLLLWSPLPDHQP